MSAGVGLIPIVALVYATWFDGFVSRDLEAWADNILFLLYIFVFVSSLASVAGRVLKVLWRLVHATVLKIRDIARGANAILLIRPRAPRPLSNRLVP